MSGAELAYSPDCPVFTGGLTAKGYYTDIYLFVNDGCVPSLAFFAVGGLNFCLNVAVVRSAAGSTSFRVADWGWPAGDLHFHHVLAPV